MARARGACMRVLLLLSVCLHACSAHENPDCPLITSQCIAGHVRDILALINVEYASADDQYNAAAAVATDFVERCMGGGAGGSQDFRPLRLLSLSYATEDSPRMVADYQQKTGFKVIVDFVENQDVVSELVWADKNAPLTYDGWIADSTTVVDMMTSTSTSMLSQINSFIRADETLQWPDVTKYVREISATYAGNIVGVPLGNNPVLLYYRKDILSAAGFDPPTTWEDLITAATVLNGSDFNRDGITDHALCFQFDECVDGHAVSIVLATMTQTAGPQTGFIFDPQTMESFVGSAAMEATLQLLQEMMSFSTRGCALVSPEFMGGACAMTITIDTLFKVVQRNSPIRDLISVARQPGSTRVLNRQTGRLEVCTRELCPYAELERTYDGREVLVNKAPGSGTGGLSGFINARQDPVYQQLTYDYFSFISEPTYSSARLKETYIVGPFRKSHLDTSAASLQQWASAGYNPDAVKEILEVVQHDIEHPNFLPNLRMRGGSSFMYALFPAIRNASAGMAPKLIASNLVAEYNAILAVSGPIADVRASLWAGLGLIPWAPPPPPPPPSNVHRADTVLDLPLILGVTIPVTIVMLLLALLALFVVARRHSKRTLFGRHWLPAAADDTTLVVTDIMDSTVLWETLNAGSMSRAVATHHSVVRKALAHFHGYEQATEGDSFLLAFHTPSDALGFAVQLQTGLLSADWDPELLAHPSCAPMAMAQSAALLSAGGGDDRFQLRCAASVLAAMGGGEAHGGWLHAGFSFTGIPPVSEVGVFVAAASPDAGAAVMPCVSGAAHLGGGDDDGATIESGSLMPVARAVSESAAATVMSLFEAANRSCANVLTSGGIFTSGGACAGGGARSCMASRGEEPAVDEPSNLSLIFPEFHAELESILVGKGSAYKKQKSSVAQEERCSVANSAAPPAGAQHDVYNFELANAMALLSGIQAMAAVSAAPGASVVHGTATMAEYMQLALVVETGARETGARTSKDNEQADIVFRGQRVRVGMHSGVSKTDVERNATAGRMFFIGTPLALGKAVGDAGAGGMILMTQDTFERLNPGSTLGDVLLLCMGNHQFKDSHDPVCLYQAIARPLVPRLAVFKALRDVEKLQLSVLDAPLGNVTVAFVNVVGMSSLEAWNKGQANRALSVFIALATRLLRQAGGYLVELTSSGLCLAAFQEPVSAVMWGLCLIEVMKYADWDEELLAHELCEKVLVRRPGTDIPLSESCTAGVLFRGPRVKVGIDMGQVQADVSPVTGRMTYRGKVMNRSARICGKASSGMQWCSAPVWEQVVSTCGEQLPSTGLIGRDLGAFELKGINNSVHLVQCKLGGGSAPMAAADVVISLAAVLDTTGSFTMARANISRQNAGNRTPRI